MSFFSSYFICLYFCMSVNRHVWQSAPSIHCVIILARSSPNMLDPVWSKQINFVYTWPNNELPIVTRSLFHALWQSLISQFCEWWFSSWTSSTAVDFTVWSVVETPIPTVNPCAKSETLTHLFSMQCSATVIGSFPLLMPPNHHCCSTASAYVQQTTDALAPPTPSSPFLYNLVSGSFLPCGAMLQWHNPRQHRGSCASYITLIMQTVSIGIHRWNSICSSGHSCTHSCCTEVVFCILNVECMFAIMHKKQHTPT